LVLISAEHKIAVLRDRGKDLEQVYHQWRGNMSKLPDPFHPSKDDGLLPNGHYRSEYNNYGMTNDSIEVWGFDRPGAPPPEVLGQAVVELLDKIDVNALF
jgi:hypothetical protein